MEAPLSTSVDSYSIHTAFNNPDVKKIIMSYLDCVSLALASRVCKQWHDILNKDEYWTPFVKKHALSAVPNIANYCNIKKLVLHHFGLFRSKEIIRNKNDLVCRAEAFFAQQKWNQAAQFSCQMGPRFDDRIIVIMTRNPHDKTLPQLNLHTLFYVDNGSGNLNPVKDEPIHFESTLNSSSTNKGLYEYKRKAFSLGKEEGQFYSQLLMPESLDDMYKQHFQRIVDRNLKRLVDEENSAHTMQTALRVATAGIAFLINQDGIYENCVVNTPIVDLSAKETVSLSI